MPDRTAEKARLEVVETGVVYRNPLPHVYARHAYFPSVVLLENGELLAAYSIGQAFESADLHTVLSRSTDQGSTWEYQGRLYDGTKDRITSDTCRLSLGSSGEVIAYVMRHDRSRENVGFLNPDNIGFVEVEQLLFRSSDGGHTWSEPQVIDPPLVGPAFEMNSSIVTLRNGAWLLPTSTWRGFDGYCPNGMKAVAFVSNDEGNTWPTHLDMMVDPEDHLIFWESKIIELSDGRILSAAWVYDQQRKQDRDNHFVISKGAGLDSSFTEPRSCGLKGQTLNLIELAPDRILTVYRRIDEPGLWANLSRMDGEEWVNEAQYPLWGTDRIGLTSHSASMAADFAVLKFGAPAFCRLASGDIGVYFWAEEDGISHIHRIHLRIESE